MNKDQEKVQLAIDSCRPHGPDGDDLVLDESDRQVLRRSQQFDQQVGELLRQGEVPVDLESRLAEQVFAASVAGGEVLEETSGPLGEMATAAVAAEGPGGDLEMAVTPAERPPGDLATRQKPAVTRRMVAAVISLGLVSVIALAVIWQGVDETGSPYRASELAGRAGHWLPRLEQQVTMPGSWSTAIGQLPTDYETDPRIIPVARQWQAFSTELDKQAVVLDISSRQHGTAYLVVIKTARQYSLPTYPLRKLTSTGDWSMAAWQTGDSLFVLVGGSDVQSLDRLVRSPDFG